MPLESAVEQALALADALGAPANDQRSPLTRREREVAHLVAGGFADREIAVQLTITASTVGVHVHHILAKLGLRSRWQIADWMAAQARVDPRAV